MCSADLSSAPHTNQIQLLSPPLCQDFCHHCHKQPPSFHSQKSPFCPCLSHLLSSVGKVQNSVSSQNIPPGIPPPHFLSMLPCLFLASLQAPPSLHPINVGFSSAKSFLSLAILLHCLIFPMALNVVTPKCESPAQIAPLSS